jgi:hypothetical protein
LVRALPVVLAAAPGVIDAVQQARRALRDPEASPREPAAPRAEEPRLSADSGAAAR